MVRSCFALASPTETKAREKREKEENKNAKKGEKRTKTIKPSVMCYVALDVAWFAAPFLFFCFVMSLSGLCHFSFCVLGWER
jgi:hypothetical protein